MKHTLVIIFALLNGALYANAGEYSININIKGLPENCEALLKDFESNTDINRTRIENGKATIKGQIQNGPRLLFLTVLAGANSYWCNFMIGNEEVWLTASVNDFPFKVHVKGSPVNDVFYALNLQLADDRMRRDSLFTRAKSIMTAPEYKTELKRLVRAMAIIDSMEIVTKKEFIEANLQSHPAVLELFLLRSSYEKEEVANMYLLLSDSLKASGYGIKLKNYLGIAKIVAKGDKAFPFTAVDKDGKTFSFPIANNKFLLLDFTKDYCPPCVQSVKELKEISKKYGSQLEVIGFSPDEKQSWLKGLQRDQATWLCLWDGKGSAGPVVLNYGVQAYPTFVLVDAAGIVVARSVGYSAGSLQQLLLPFLK